MLLWFLFSLRWHLFTWRRNRACAVCNFWPKPDLILTLTLTIAKLRSAFCKLHILTNCGKH